jgi:transcriptional regulator with XRE-family HTH domain
MRRRAQPPAAVPVPFDPASAWSARRVLGLAPAAVARDMAAHGVTVSAPQVIAWESGELLPSERELVALARALWCTPGQLMGGRAMSIRDHRLALELPQEELARRLGLSPRVYAQLESAPRWEGDADQTYLLAQALNLTPYGLMTATGREDELKEVLQRAVDGRWQSQVPVVCRMIPTLHPDDVGYVLQVIHDENQASSAMWGGTAQSDEETGGPGPQTPAERFWSLLSG